MDCQGGQHQRRATTAGGQRTTYHAPSLPAVWLVAVGVHLPSEAVGAEVGADCGGVESAGSAFAEAAALHARGESSRVLMLPPTTSWIKAELPEEKTYCSGRGREVSDALQRGPTTWQRRVRPHLERVEHESAVVVARVGTTAARRHRGEVSAWAPRCNDADRAAPDGDERLTARGWLSDSCKCSRRCWRGSRGR